MVNPLAEDLDHILAHTEGLWEELRGKRIFITGGTGFIGCWLLESFAWANDNLNLGASAVILTRRPCAFKSKVPHLAGNPAFHFLTGDVRSFEFPEGPVSHVIHAATEASAQLNEEDPNLMLDTIDQGTFRALEFSRSCGAQKFLLTSSGAVYGKQPSDMTNIPETYHGGPDPMDVGAAYSEGKRLAEWRCATFAKLYGIEAKIARLFAFVGPYLPLDAHFAVGNFIRDGLQGGPIRVTGDGTPFRSYMYAADLAVWLWTILFKGESCQPYNVGSEDEISIADLAEEVSSSFRHKPEVVIAKKPIQGVNAERYVPSTRMAYEQLGLTQLVDLRDMLRRTIQSHTNSKVTA